MSESITQQKAQAFALRIVRMCEVLMTRQAPRSLIDQVRRSGTSIFANLCEARYAVSPRDFYNKHMIALKEAEETKGWLELLHQMQALTLPEHSSIVGDCQELLRLLVATTKTLKERLS